MVFENANEPILDRDVWEAVQLKRGKVRNKRMVTGEQNMFSGLLVCSTCGGNLNFHFSQTNHDITYFNCANYNNRGSTCNATHYIRTDFLEQVVKHIYVDSVNGKISEARFAKMSKKYEDEQAEVQKKLDLLQKELRCRAKKQGTAKEFLDIIKRYTKIEMLTPQILREFVEKIIVHHRKRIDGVDVQKIEIFYNCVGQLNLPEKPALPETDILINTRKGVALSYSQSQKVS